MRQRVTIEKGLEGMLEIARGPIAPGETDHAQDILDANNAGDTEKVVKLIREGYKRERWL